MAGTDPEIVRGRIGPGKGMPLAHALTGGGAGLVKAVHRKAIERLKAPVLSGIIINTEN
ncbi:hypothetical protein D9M70_645490 [compost metagenome]